MKKISIITTVNQNPSGLAQTIRSLKPLLSSGLVWEHVIVDASPDEHRSVLQDSVGIWPRTHIPASLLPDGVLGSAGGVPMPGMAAAPGPSSSLKNLGWRRAEGRLFLFLAAGERLRDLDSLVACVNFFKKDSRCDILLASADLCRDGKTVSGLTPHPSFIRNLLGVNRICNAAVIYRASSFERAGEFLPDYKYAAEYEHLFRCYLAGFKHQSTRRRLVQIDVDTGPAVSDAQRFDEYEAVHGALASRLPAQISRFNRYVLGWERTKTDFRERSVWSIARDAGAALRKRTKK